MRGGGIPDAAWLDRCPREDRGRLSAATASIDSCQRSTSCGVDLLSVGISPTR
jgi:hypothetical protein